jgi:hypothetical protein
MGVFICQTIQIVLIEYRHQSKWQRTTDVNPWKNAALSSEPQPLKLTLTIIQVTIRSYTYSAHRKLCINAQKTVHSKMFEIRNAYDFNALIFGMPVAFVAL